MPFSLVYGIEFVILIEIRVPTRLVLTKDQNVIDRVIGLVLTKERKNKALRRMIEQERCVID